MIKGHTELIRAKGPLIHCITNYVTANDCANILLACGASPVMADFPDEAADIAAKCSALVINTGTLNPDRLNAMLIAGKTANSKEIPVVLDPVGAGASDARTDAVRRLISEVRFSAIRGNVSEMRAIACGDAATKGVDAALTDSFTADEAKALSERLGAVIIVSGSNDIIADSSSAYIIKNGSPFFRKITGAGCMLSCMTAAYLSTDNSLGSAASAVCAMGICGETAQARMTAMDGNATFRNYVIDAVYNLTDSIFEERADYDRL